MKKPSLNELIRERLAQGLPVTVQWAKDQGYTANAFRVAMHRIRKAEYSEISGPTASDE